MPARNSAIANSSNETVNAVIQAETIAGAAIGMHHQPERARVGRAEVHRRVLELRLGADEPGQHDERRVRQRDDRVRRS